ncbi:MAG: PKD domain-containing protein [Armatimonadota bacterium]
MQTLSSTVTHRYLRLLVLGAAILGCVLLLPAACTAATITVQITKPDKNATIFDVNKEYDFEAIAFIDGVELPGGQIAWEWDFDDGTAPSTDNPAKHTYTACKTYHVTVTATYRGEPAGPALFGSQGNELTGQDSLDLLLGTPGSASLAGAFQWEARCGGQNGPKFAGDVCDDVSVVLRVPQTVLRDTWGIIVGVRFWRTVNGIPMEQYGMEQGPIDEFRDDRWWTAAYCQWGSGADKNTEPVTWTAEVLMHMAPPPGGQAPYLQTLPIKGASWAPNNLVITGSSPLLIPHKKDETEHTINWSSTHLIDEEAGVTGSYQAGIQILNLSGSQISAHEVVAQAGKPGSFTWHPNLPPESDADTIYTFRVNGGHGALCSDGDRVDLLGEVLPKVQIAIDWDTLKLKGRIGYTAATELDEPKLTIYGPTTAEISLEASAGYHEVEYQLDIGYGKYWAVITAKQPQEQGEINRDGMPKPVLPKGCPLGSIPGPPQAVEILDPNGEPRLDSKFSFDLNGDCAVGNNANGSDQGQASPATGTVTDFPYLNGGLSWSLTPIPGSNLSSTPASARGPSVTFSYHDLPANNSDFGGKSLQLAHPLVASSDAKEVEIYYPGGLANHPGQGRGRIPNWFYYWKNGGVVGGIDQFDFAESTLYAWDAYGYMDTDDGHLYLGNPASGSSPGGDDPGEILISNKVYPNLPAVKINAGGTGVFCCRLTIIHELKHRELWDMVRQGAQDSDGDTVPDSVEDSTCVPGGLWLDKSNRDTYGLHEAMPYVPYEVGDNELLAYREQSIAADNGAVASSANPHADWRAGGHNWGEYYDYIRP